MVKAATRLLKVESYRRNERERQKRARAKYRDLIRDIKIASGGCSICGEAHLACLQFHHRDPDQKDFAINRASVLKIPIDLLKIEIKKCVLLCANCHAKLHWNEEW